MAPSIRGIEPSSGPIGAKVHIMGTGFGTDGFVSFNNTKAKGAVADKKAADGVKEAGPAHTPTAAEAKTAAAEAKAAKAEPLKAAVEWTDSYIDVEVPEGATTGDVVVVVDGVQSNGSLFTVTAV